LVTCCFGPFLCKGVTFASFQVFGIFLVSIDFWNILVVQQCFWQSLSEILDAFDQVPNKIKAELLNTFFQCIYN
jgi:hypothetical protein